MYGFCKTHVIKMIDLAHFVVKFTLKKNAEIFYIMFGSLCVYAYFCPSLKQLRRSGEVGEWLKPPVC